MKVLLAGFILWVGLMSFSSCKKDYTCQCTFVDTTKNFTTTISNMYKNEAKVVCNDYAEFVGNCTLK